ncbi:hypothetical protein E2320_022716 [Naja naja]|nr:hypothetical protein E2320_022716 [Naja naja]
MKPKIWMLALLQDLFIRVFSRHTHLQSFTIFFFPPDDNNAQLLSVIVIARQPSASPEPLTTITTTISTSRHAANDI